MQIAYDSVHVRLVEAVPEFAPTLAEHLEAQEGELLQHVLFGDLTRFVVEAYERGDYTLVSRCLDFLDEALRDGDEMTQNLVAVSFVENVGPWDEAAQEFIAGWPAALREEARRQREWQPEDEESGSEEGEELPSLRSPKGEGWCPRCGRRLRHRDEYGTYLCECGMAVTYGEGRPYQDDMETESAPHRPIRWVLVAIILLVMALVLAFLLFARRGPIPYGGDGDCFIGRDGSPECVIP